MNSRFPSRLLLGVLLLTAVFLVGCGDNAPQVVEPPPPAVTVSKPLERQAVNFDEYEGRIAPVKTVEVRARVRGHLTKVAFEDGQIVKAGAPLYEIDHRTYRADYDRARGLMQVAEAKVKLAKADHMRALEVAKTPGAISQQDVDKYAAQVSVSEAEISSATAAVEEAKLNVDFTKIAAPIEGRISRTLVDVGNLVNAGGGETLLTTIVSIDPMVVYFNVDERSLLRYRKSNDPESKGKSVKELKIPVEVALEGEDNFPHKGVVDFAENRVDPRTGTISIRGVLPNGARILDAGMRARVRVPISDPYKALMITDRAIGTDQGLRFVYVVAPDKVAKRREVVLGRQFDGLRIIDRGLRPGDDVIVIGIQYVRPEMKVDPKPGEMPGAKALAQQ